MSDVPAYTHVQADTEAVSAQYICLEVTVDSRSG